MALTTVTDAHAVNTLATFLSARAQDGQPMPTEAEGREAFGHLIAAAHNKLGAGITYQQATEIWSAIITRLNTPEGTDRTADVVLLAEEQGVLYVLLVRRRWEPFAGRWALPGGYVDAQDRTSAGEGQDDTEVAARRELKEETGLDAPAQLRRVGVYDAPGRDPRGPVASTVYTGRLDHRPAPTAGDDAEHARWMPVGTVLAMPDQVAFDHVRILADVVDSPVTA